MTNAQAIAIRQARHARVRIIRQRVIAGVVALFIATWLLITVMLVTGHDPALARQSANSAATTTTSSNYSNSSSTSSGATSTNTGGQSGVGTQSSSGTSSVSSSQS